MPKVKTKVRVSRGPEPPREVVRAMPPKARVETEGRRVRTTRHE
jgi:hypothetical protein